MELLPLERAQDFFIFVDEMLEIAQEIGASGQPSHPTNFGEIQSMTSQTATPQSYRDATRPIHILLVEDQNEDALLIQELLGLARGFNFRLRRASTLADARQLIQKAPPDVILSDLNLPDCRGYETFRRISSLVPAMPVILLTGLDDETLALQAIRAGAQDYLIKTDLGASPALLPRAITYAIERKRTQDALQESQERYLLVTEGANDGLWDWNLRTKEIYFSPRWKLTLGYQDHEFPNQSDEWLKRIHPEDIQGVKMALASHLNGYNQHFECQYRILHKDSSYRWVLTRGLAVRDSSGVPYRMAGSQTDITTHKQAEERVLYDALHDHLTGLPNRNLFLDRLDRAIQHRKRRQSYLFAVLFLDLDRFKLINDSLGHAIGDQLLVTVAQKLTSCLRAGDTVSRLGGDEFVILLDDIQRQADATEIADRIQQALKTPTELNQYRVATSASIGVVPSSSDYQKPEEMLRDADIAMYHAKTTGKACHAIFDNTMRRRVMDRLELETDLHQALELTLAGSGMPGNGHLSPDPSQSAFQVYYQPIIALNNWKIIGFEALLRWRHPQRGFIPPKEFIPLAEETGLIHALGLWVLRQACQQLRTWQARYPMDPPLEIHVNISGKQFSQPDLVERFQQALEEAGLNSQHLILEITESLFVENNELFNQTLSRLCELGIKLHIDDFGTGYSSFSYLQRLPVSSIKIDATFIEQMQENPNHAEIVRSIVTLARSLGLSAIAEGVETEGQMAHLKELGCSYGQGYYISTPVTSDAASHLIRLSRQTGRLTLPA